MNLFTTAQIEAIKDAERMLINVRQTLSTAKDEVLNSLSSDDIDNIMHLNFVRFLQEYF